HRGLAPEQIVSLAESEDCRGALSRFLITQPRWDYSVEAAKQWAERRQRIRRVRDLARAITTPGSDTDLTEQLQRLYAEAGIHRLSQGQHPEHTQGA
ncbi:MAG: hypothetical protein ACE5JJ_12295, partial [Nitrospinota bacterium]